MIESTSPFVEFVCGLLQFVNTVQLAVTLVAVLVHAVAPTQITEEVFVPVEPEVATVPVAALFEEVCSVPLSSPFIANMRKAAPSFEPAVVPVHVTVSEVVKSACRVEKNSNTCVLDCVFELLAAAQVFPFVSEHDDPVTEELVCAKTIANTVRVALIVEAGCFVAENT